MSGWAIREALVGVTLAVFLSVVAFTAMRACG